jgi:hypothetical protein
MAQHKCADSYCNGMASGRNLFCMKCWYSIPEYLRLEIRNETEKGEHTLRAKPTREWMSKALKYCVDVR